MFSANTSQVSQDAVFIEDTFSSYLYTGTGAALTINNGIDLAGKGGLVWFKSRSNAYSNALLDTARGTNKMLQSDSTAANSTFNYLTSFNSNGVTFPGSFAVNNNNGATYALWTFRKQPKFFDVVTYTGDGTANRSVSHSLGSTPGCIIVKQTNTTRSWFVFHRSLANGGTTEELSLNSTAAASGNGYFPAVSSTTFSVSASSAVNQSGGTYVAYLFAHDAGGFGLTGTDNVISCGSYTASGTSTTVTLGYEPQWVLIKKTNVAGDNWRLLDTMRGMTVAGSTKYTLAPNTSAAEESWSDAASPSATGFTVDGAGLNDGGDSYIYIAIRRGPMKTPTSGTSVFAPVTYTGDGTNTLDITAGFPVDMFLNSLTNVADERLLKDRLRGGGVTLSVTETTAESTSYTIGFDSNTQILNMPSSWYSQNGVPYVDWLFRRAPSFFDVVCYTGTGSALTVNHNLGAVPELMIVKRRDSTGFWAVYSAATGAANVLELQSSAASTSGTAWNSTAPTASVFTVGNTIATGVSGGTYVAYLFASCPGVSKVGSYSGTGALQTINCGFTSGARFVLIKRTDSTGDWWLYDSARGITSGNDPYLFLNTQSAQVTNTNYVDTDTTGFKVTAAAPAGLNASGGTYIFLAIA